MVGDMVDLYLLKCIGKCIEKIGELRKDDRFGTWVCFSEIEKRATDRVDFGTVRDW